ncbi:MAG: type IV pilus modification protein PilV [Gammaproteobacteria bacterium]|nr:type IV pilus modification protein PilV [Gammaproteobacteria bacterium]
MNQTTQQNEKRHQGYSLLEILVALLVLSIGLLGLAALQTMGLKFNQQSYQRTQAAVLAYDIIDRIRANSLGKTAGYYNNVAANAMPSVSGGQCVSTASLCAPNQLADYDVASWKNNITALLVSGTGAVNISGARSVVTIKWRENEEDMQLDVEADL